MLVPMLHEDSIRLKSETPFLLLGWRVQTPTAQWTYPTIHTGVAVKFCPTTSSSEGFQRDLRAELSPTSQLSCLRHHVPDQHN